MRESKDPKETVPNHSMHIILADDDLDDRTLFAEALKGVKNATIQFETCNDGIELMNHLNDPENKLPHILFLDLNMPRKSGLECLHEIRANSRFNDVSIAIFSTSNAEKDIENTLSGGANIYIHKPDTFKKLKDAIQHVLRINWQFHLSGMSKETFFLNI